MVVLRANGRNSSQHCWRSYTLTGFKLNWATTRSLRSRRLEAVGGTRERARARETRELNNMQQGVQTDAKCIIQQCWALVANNIASVFTGH